MQGEGEGGDGVLSSPQISSFQCERSTGGVGQGNGLCLLLLKRQCSPCRIILSHLLEVMWGQQPVSGKEM